MLRTHSKTVFSGPRTPEKIRTILRMNAFVHITGLVATSQSGDSYIVGEHPRIKCGWWDRNNNKIVVVTLEGEVWLRSGIPAPQKNGVLDTASLQSAINLAAPNGQGAFVPLSNGEEVYLHLLLCRIADPDYGIEYEEEPRVA